jgi:hypothetical protein
MNRRFLLLCSALYVLLLWQVPTLSAEEIPLNDSSGLVHSGALWGMIATAATREGVDPALVEAIIAVESAYNSSAISPKGAVGLMQLMPQTASRYRVSNPFDPEENLTGGIRYLRDLFRRFGRDLPRVLAAYNAGETAVLRYRGIPPFRETVEYVRKVLARYRAGRVTPSFPSVSSIGRLESQVGSPASSGINPASTTRVTSTAARRPLTKMFRGALVHMKTAPPISVKLRVRRYRRSS